MMYKEVETEDDFFDLNLEDDFEVFHFLVENYSDESAQALSDFVEIEKDLGCLDDCYLSLFFELYDYGQLIEWIDDYIDEDVLVNYYIRDCCCGWDVVLVSGYGVV